MATPIYSSERLKRLSEDMKARWTAGNYAPRVGKKHSMEAKKKMSLAKQNYIPWNKGKTGVYSEETLGKLRKPFTQERKNNISLALVGKRVGIKSPRWIDGRSYEKYPAVFNRRLRKEIRERDGYKCQLCRRTEEWSKQHDNRVLAVNHIDFNKNNCDKNNPALLDNLK